MCINYLSPFGICLILRDECGVEFPFDFVDLKDWIVDNMVKQFHTMAASDDVSQWWEAIHFFMMRHSGDALRDGHDFQVKKKAGMKFNSTRTETSKKCNLYQGWTEPKNVLYISMTMAFPLYKQQLGEKHLDRASIMMYLKDSPAYLGQVKGVTMKGGNKSCWIFDADKLPIDLNETDESKLESGHSVEDEAEPLPQVEPDDFDHTIFPDPE